MANKNRFIGSDRELLEKALAETGRLAKRLDILETKYDRLYKQLEKHDE